MDALILEWRTKMGKKKLEKEWKSIRRGWFLGGETFRTFLSGLLERVMEGKQRDSFSGESANLHDEIGAEKWLSHGLMVLGVNPEDLPTLKLCAPEKAVIAWLIRTRTTVRNRWIAERLVMGYPGNVSAYVKKAREANTGLLLELRRKLEKSLKYED
ncbi:MAG: hypothetical protein ACYTHM_05465 [Planctomycetota bacterium]